MQPFKRARHRRRKLFYPAGIISLAALPLIVLHCIQQDKRLKHYTGMNIYYVDDAWLEENAKLFHWSRQVYPKRNYTEIEITGDTYYDELKLHFGRLMIHELMVIADTLHGVRFHFGPNAKYEHWVHAIDAAALSYQPAFGNYLHSTLYHNDICYYNYIRSGEKIIGEKLKSTKFDSVVPIQFMECGYRPMEEKEKKRTWWLEASAYRRYWPVGACWLLLLVMAVWRIGNLKFKSKNSKPH